MTRRLLGPFGRPILFLLVAGLVFAGLGWVTVEALQVEDAQRQGALRADREKDLRIALWRLDGRMLPALGVEDTRPFHEFNSYTPDAPITVYGPECAPLLAADLPDWMQLHFQVDPEGSWESPQVLSPATEKALRANWPELPLRNASAPRAELLAQLAKKFPARQVSELFSLRERAVPLFSTPAQPFSSNLPAPDSDRKEEPRSQLAPARFDIPPVSPPLPAPALARADGYQTNATHGYRNSGVIGRKVTAQPAEPQTAEKLAPEPRPAPPTKKPETNYFAHNFDQNRSDYAERDATRGKAIGDAQGVGRRDFPYYFRNSNGLVLNPQAGGNQAKQIPGGLAQSGMGGGFGGPNGRSNAVGFGAPAPRGVPGPGGPTPAAAPPTAGGFGPLALAAPSKSSAPRGSVGGDAAKPSLDGKKDEAKKADASGPAVKSGAAPNTFGFVAPRTAHSSTQFKRVESEKGGLLKLMDDEKAKETLRRQTDSLHLGNLSQERLDESAPTGGRTVLPGAAKPRALGRPPAGPRGITENAVPGPTHATLPARPAPLAPLVKKPVPPTPDPMPPAELEPAASPAPMPPPITDDGPPPVAVHLSSLRPQWLTAADGSEALVVVRSARLENKKTIYQGVVLDWNKLQAALKEEVKDLFPDSSLRPAKDATEAREQTMSALPVQLDPGPLPALPSAGWTPLRIGLLLAWLAAGLAFTAVGLTGWSLVDLAERRIRFVSAVTHELRTPLTSLRLYLDLLLSGMVHDEEKRREYLSTLNVESDRLHRLIDNVLDYARLEGRRKGRTLHAANAADLLESIRRTWADRVAADGKELVVSSTLSAEQELVTDASLVQQIVGNLIDNARKYTRDAADPHIWMKARQEGNRVVIEVEDRGAGVLPREQKLIFRPFRRGETADTTAGGAGLGLALSKEWAELLGGRLSYRTAEGGTGSCFRLELPIK